MTALTPDGHIDEEFAKRAAEEFKLVEPGTCWKCGLKMNRDCYPDGKNDVMVWACDTCGTFRPDDPQTTTGGTMSPVSFAGSPQVGDEGGVGEASTTADDPTLPALLALTPDDQHQADIDQMNHSLDRFEDALAYLDRARGSRGYDAHDAEHVHSILEGNA